MDELRAMHKTLTALAVLAVILLGGCAEGRPTFGVVSGSVAYEPPAALPPGAEIQVRLYDLSRGDGEGALVAEHRTEASSEGVPADFAMRYDPGLIDPTHSYAVRARLAGEDEPLLETSEPYPVLTQGHPHRVELVLEPTVRPAELPDAPVDLVPAIRKHTPDD